MAGHRIEEYAIYKDDHTLTLGEYRKARKDNPEKDKDTCNWLMRDNKVESLP